MGMTFFSVGDTVLIPAKIKLINITDSGAKYYAEPENLVKIVGTHTILFFESDREKILLKHEKETSNG